VTQEYTYIRQIGFKKDQRHASQGVPCKTEWGVLLSIPIKKLKGKTLTKVVQGRQAKIEREKAG